MNGSDWLELEEKGLVPPPITPREALDLIKKQLMMTPQNKELFKIIEDALPFDTDDWLAQGAIKLENLQRALKARIELNKNIIETEHLDKITFAKLEAEVSLCNLLLMLLEE
jgi:hypothetical protein